MTEFKIYEWIIRNNLPYQTWADIEEYLLGMGKADYYWSSLKLALIFIKEEDALAFKLKFGL